MLNIKFDPNWEIGDVVFEGRLRFFNGESDILIATEPDRLRIGSDLMSRLTDT